MKRAKWLYIPQPKMSLKTRCITFAFLVLVVGTLTLSLLLPIYSPAVISYNGVEIGNVAFEDMCNWMGSNLNIVANLSRLGRLLFHHDSEVFAQQNRSFKILIWKHGPMMERRHLKHFGSTKHDPLEGCSVSNCRFTYKDTDLSTADAVLFHLHRMKGLSTMPPSGPRPPNQRWVFLSDESLYNTFLYFRKNTLAMYDGLFNWSMTYRMDSDVPVPYGRTVPLSIQEQRQILKPLLHSYAKNQSKSKLVAIMASNCAGRNNRWDYIWELQKHVQVDVYGHCGPLKLKYQCPGHFHKECPILAKYKFYLAFENSNCRDYVTEKAWWNAYHYNAVPIIMGMSKEDCSRILPPKSYIHVSEFASPEDLARYLLYLNESDSQYNSYFLWKICFKVLNEHGYFQTPVFHYCRLCEALNYNDPSPKVYSHLKEFLNADKFCYTK